MADNLLEMAVRHLGSSGLSALGSALGLPDGKSESAFKSSAATVLTGMLNKAGSESGLGTLLNLANKSTSMDLSNPADIFTSPDRMSSLQDVGGNIVDTLFGHKRDGVVNTLASSLGLTASKGSSLLRIAAPIIMSLVGKLVKSKGLNMEGLSALLLGQKAHVRDRVPPGLLRELGVANFDELAERTVVETTPRHTARAATPPPPPPVRKSGWAKWLWPLLIALGVLWALNMCAKKDRIDDGTGVVQEQDEVIVEETPATPATPDRTVTPVPDTTQEPATTGDFGQQLRDYLASASRDPNREFPLHIEFPTDGSMPNAASLPDVQTLISIMRENPGLSVAIEGHTDTDGDAGANQKLSESRAQAVMKMLTDAGIDTSRVTAVGVGSANPVADNNTEEGKQKNRRIAVKVTAYEQQ